jgi:hypothetical protein
VSELKLTYRRGPDRLEAHVSGAGGAASTVVRRDKVTLHIDRSRPAVDSFELADFSHFVAYHLLAQLFGDEAIRKISLFQTDVVEARRDAQRTIEVEPPVASHRVVNDLLKAA